MFIGGRRVTVESINFITLPVKEILRSNKMESAHLPHAGVQKQFKMNRFKQRHFKLSKNNKQYVHVVLYFVDLPNYKFPATHH